MRLSRRSTVTRVINRTRLVAITVNPPIEVPSTLLAKSRDPPGKVSISFSSTSLLKALQRL